MRAIVFDLSRTLLFPKDGSYRGSLNGLYRERKGEPFFSNFRLNEELLAFLEKSKERLPRLCLFTSEDIQNAPEIAGRLKALFDPIISAKELGVSKGEPEAYMKVSGLLGSPPEEILLVDDSEENVAAARESGMRAIRFADNRETIAGLEKAAESG